MNGVCQDRGVEIITILFVFPADLFISLVKITVVLRK